MPPTENGERLATLERGDDEQVRINWATYEGHPYVSFRLWTRDQLGQWWPDKARGITVRLREIDQVVEALTSASDLAEVYRSLPQPARQTPIRGPHKPRRQPAAPGPVERPIPTADASQGQAEPFDEFQ